jgi:hypothetical protein
VPHFISTTPLREWLTQWRQRVLSIVIISAIALGLTACSNGNFPSTSVIERAIAHQVEQIQQPLSQQLKLPAPSLKDIRISHVTITDRDTTLINGEAAYHIIGEYDLTLKQTDHQANQTGDRFDLYLQPKQTGKTTTWQLAQATGDDWKLEPLSSGKS